MPVEVGAGAHWWSRLFQLSECLSVANRVIGLVDWAVSAAVVGGVGGPVACCGVLPFDGDLDVDPEQSRDDGGGQVGLSRTWCN